MDSRLTLVLLFFFYANVYCDCDGIMESMMHCKKYSCARQVEDGKYIRYKILGRNSKGLCVYVEKYGDDEMICYHSQDGMRMEKEYFENISQQQLDIMVNLRANECFFIHLNEINQDNMIREVIDDDFDLLLQYSSVKSIFFDEGLVDKVVNEMEKFNLKPSTAVVKPVIENFDSETVKLDSIVYSFFGTWKIWVNGKLFSDTKDLKVQSVTEDRVTFVWHVDKKLIKKDVDCSKNVSFDDSNIKFTLYPKQEFDLKSLCIK